MEERRCLDAVCGQTERKIISTKYLSAITTSPMRQGIHLLSSWSVSDNIESNHRKYKSVWWKALCANLLRARRHIFSYSSRFRRMSSASVGFSSAKEPVLIFPLPL